MKKLYSLIIMLPLVTSLFAQELDSLQRIMNKDKDFPQSEIEAPVVDPVDVPEPPLPPQPADPVIVDDDPDEVSIKILDKEVVRVIEAGDSTKVKVGARSVLEVVDHRDSTSIRVGDKEVWIVERDGDTEIQMQDVNREHKIRNPRFRGHWAGVEWGLNNFLDSDMSMARGTSDWYMDLNTGRSWNVNINFAQFSIGFGTSHVGLVTGLGFEFNNYFFDNDNSIIEIDDYAEAELLTGNVSKTKLTTTFLRVPVILEFQFPNTIRAKRMFISAGIVGGLKLGSHTKVVYKDNGKNKDKNRDDFNINPFRYGLTARLGYGNVSVYADYYLTQMFVENKGPELYPFNLGIAMSF